MPPPRARAASCTRRRERHDERSGDAGTHDPRCHRERQRRNRSAKEDAQRTHAVVARAAVGDAAEDVEQEFLVGVLPSPAEILDGGQRADQQPVL